MQCPSDLVDRFRQGMDCEAEIDRWVVTWKPAGREHVRRAAESHFEPLQGSDDRPEHCPDCRQEYVMTRSILGYSKELQIATLDLVCGNCDWGESVSLTPDEDQRLAFIQDFHREQMASDIKNIDLLAFLDWGAKFFGALQAGAIQPEDF